jgi:hypothetical protein
MKNHRAMSSTVLFAEEERKVSLARLQTGDQVLFWTRHSFYNFLVTDGTRVQGQLRRSAPEPQEAEAVLLGTEADNPALAVRAELRTSARALFLIGRGEQTQRLLTSDITRIMVISAARPAARLGQPADTTAGLSGQ